MSNVHLWVHVVWGTHDRRPLLQQPFRQKMISHIQENCQLKSIPLKAINGYLDHLHCLVDLPVEMPVSRLVMLLKGESSFWVNKNKIVPFRFQWAHEYYARSVSESALPRLIDYIQFQEFHHRGKSWAEELKEFLGDTTYMKG